MDPRLSIGMARVLADTGHYESAVASLQADLPALRARLEDGGVEAQWDLAFALHNLGASLSELGSAREARSIFGEVLEIRRRMAKGGDNDKVLALAESLVVAGAVESDLGEQRRALRWIDEALALLEPLSDRLPESGHSPPAPYAALLSIKSAGRVTAMGHEAVVQLERAAVGNAAEGAGDECLLSGIPVS
jgi:tetratricopeptide (TPR) repeat protein